jgi:3-deoxy-D-manno-octulosonate 8-phosphate phosphatase (KDO 8-P phosphatase)
MAIDKQSSDAIARARKIKLLLLDVDGVLTDGTIWVLPMGGPAPEQTSSNAQTAGDGGFGVEAHSAVIELKGFNAHDGIGISLARLAGLQLGLITKRRSEAVRARARDLKIEHVYQAQAHKMDAVEDMMRKTGVTLEEIAFAGDDIVDLPVMRACGLAIAPADARAEALAAAHYITPRNGGRGAARDAVEFILQAQGKLESTVARYVDPQDATARQSDIGQGSS